MPGVDFSGECLPVGDAAVEALAGEDGQFGFRHVEPTTVFGRIVPFEPLGDAPRFGGRESLIKRCLDMGVEVILHEGDLFGFRKVGVGQVLQNMRVIDGGAPLGNLDMAPAFERRAKPEKIGGAACAGVALKTGRPGASP